jgi:hypothetical protein
MDVYFPMVMSFDPSRWLDTEEQPADGMLEFRLFSILQ